MKIESRFLILLTSVFVGGVTGLVFFYQGDFFPTAMQRLEGVAPPVPALLKEKQASEISAREEIHQKLTPNRTLYEFVAKSEERKAEVNSKQTDLEPSAIVKEESEKEIASVEVNSENMGEILAEMAQYSPKLNESLNALAQARNITIPKSTPEIVPSPQIAEAKSRALIHVSDFSQSTLVSDEGQAKNRMEFQHQNVDEAQNTLSRDLLAMTPELRILPKDLEPVQINRAIGTQTVLPNPSEKPSVSNPQVSVQPQESIQAQPSVQNQNQVQVSSDTLEQVQMNQATGSRMELSGSPEKEAAEISENLDQNPLAEIMGLKATEKEESEDTKEAKTESGNESGPNTELVQNQKTEIKSKTEVKQESEIQAETEQNQVTDDSENHQPTRMKKPVRNQTTEIAGEKGTAFEKNEYSLDVYRVNIRKALASFQIETGLKIVASLDVQGTVSCKSKNSDPEVLLASLLADTQFRFVKSGNFIYVARPEQLVDLPKPLEKTDTEVFVPKNISLEELELVFRSNLSQFGMCEETRDSSGTKGLSVTDWVLNLEQLEKIQEIVDVPAPEERLNAFVFQRELDGTFKALELTELAESQGLVLQRVSPLDAEAKEEKKNLLYGRKKEKTSNLQAFTISYRPDTFMVSVRNQLKTQPAPMPGQTSSSFQLEQPMRFDFNLNVQERLVPYQITVTYHGNTENSGGTTAEVVCAPREELGSKTRANDFHFTIPISTENRNSLIFQLNLGEFPVENAGKRKDISYMMHGNRMQKEVIIVLCPFQNIPKIKKNGFSTQAIREIVRQQEVLARKFYGSLNPDEREDSKRCFGIAQRLRLGIGETLEPVNDEIPQKIELE